MEVFLNIIFFIHKKRLVYSLLTPFFAGAQCELLPKFEHRLVWSKLLNEKSSEEPNVNIFIGVPTIFTQLVNSDFIGNKESFVKNVLNKKMRFIASGSAPLIVKTFKDWYELTNFNIVERYGMTEIGMALTNPYIDTDYFKKEAGLVGRPVGAISCRLVYQGKVLIESQENKDFIYEKEQDLFGELQIKGPNVFSEYINKPEQTKECFTSDGWFKTGKIKFDSTMTKKEITL